MKIPKVKKSIKTYINNEDGKISKQALIAMGAMVGASALSGLAKDAVAHGNSHSNNINLKIVDNVVHGQHTHHASY